MIDINDVINFHFQISFHSCFMVTKAVICSPFLKTMTNIWCTGIIFFSLFILYWYIFLATDFCRVDDYCHCVLAVFMWLPQIWGCVKKYHYCEVWVTLTCSECGRSAGRARTASIHCLHNDRVLLSTDQAVEVTGCAHLTAGGAVSIEGGCLDAVGGGCSCVTPADQSFTCSAVQASWHIGGRTGGWKRREGQSGKRNNTKIK